MMSQQAPNEQSASYRLHNDPERIRAVQAEVLEAAQKAGYGKSASFSIRLAMEEAIRNAFEHGRRGSNEPIDVSWRVTPQRVTIEIHDYGPGFDPDAVPDCTADENLERPCGRGLLLMRAYMSSVEFNEIGNFVRMRYEAS